MTLQLPWALTTRRNVIQTSTQKTQRYRRLRIALEESSLFRPVRNSTQYLWRQCLKQFTVNTIEFELLFFFFFQIRKSITSFEKLFPLRCKIYFVYDSQLGAGGIFKKVFPSQSKFAHYFRWKNMYSIDMHQAPDSDIGEKVIHANKKRINTLGCIYAVDSRNSRTLGHWSSPLHPCSFAPHLSGRFVALLRWPRYIATSAVCMLKH